MIKASGRSALMVVMGLFVCLAGAAYTNAASEAAGSKSDSVTATKSVKQGTRHWKRHAHRKDVSTAKNSSVKAEEVADASGEMPVSLPPEVANANARIDVQLDEPTGTTKAMTERANAILLAQADIKPTEVPAAVAPAADPATAPAVVAPDQLNEVDRTLQETAPASQAQATPGPSQTVAMAATAVKAGPPAPPPAAASDSSTWDQTSLIGKIFIAIGALLTIASAARMFMA